MIEGLPIWVRSEMITLFFRLAVFLPFLFLGPFLSFLYVYQNLVNTWWWHAENCFIPVQHWEENKMIVRNLFYIVYEKGVFHTKQYHECLWKKHMYCHVKNISLATPIQLYYDNEYMPKFTVTSYFNEKINLHNVHISLKYEKFYPNFLISFA